MLIIRLQTPNDAEPAWALLGGGQTAAEWRHGSWNELSNLTRGQQIVLLIPSREVLLTQTNINTRNPKQLKQAVPYALEDVLIEDPETQHMVWQARGDSTLLDVAVIGEERLREWGQALQAHQLRAYAVLPDIFALPWEAGSLTIWQQGEQIWVRTGLLGGYSATSSVFPLMLESLLTEHSGDEPLRVRLYTDQPADWQTDSRVDAVPETHAESLLEGSFKPALVLNLLNGFQDEVSANLRQQWRRWRLAAILAGVTLALLLAQWGVGMFRLNEQLKTVDEANLALFAELFPDAGTVDPRELNVRLESELASLRGKAGKQGASDSPLKNLSALAAALAKAPGLKLEEVSSQEAELSAVLQSPDLQALDKLEQDLETRSGQAVEVQTSRTADVVKANLKLGGRS